MNIIKRNCWWLGGGGGASIEFDLFGIVGDSLASGASNSTGIGPITPAGTCYEYNGSALVELTTADLSTAPANNGTPWKQFALDYYNATGRGVIFVIVDGSGSEFYPNGDNNNWYTSGDLYAAWTTKLNSAITFTSLPLSGILLILGINDFRSANTTANIKTGSDSLFLRLNTDYPTAPVYGVNFGRSESFESSLSSARQFDQRKNFIDGLNTYSINRLAGKLSAFVSVAANYYGADTLHLTQTGNNVLGSIVCSAVLNTETNQQVANAINPFFTFPTVLRYAAYKTFIEGCQSDGNWDLLDGLQVYKTDVKNNIFVPLWGYGNPQDDGFIFNANESIETNSTNILRQNYFANVTSVRSTSTDFIEGCKILTNLTAAGVEGGIFGTRSGTSIIRIIQTVTSVLFYNAYDGTNTTYATDTKFQDNTWYAVERNAGTKRLYKNGVSVSSAAVATTASNNLSEYLGSVNAADAEQSTIAGKFQCWYRAKAVGFNSATFQARVDTLLTAL